jgi:hypothetical protein
MLYDKKKRIFLLKMYNETESLKAVQRAYQAKYKCKSALFLLSKNTVRSLGQQKTGDLSAKNEERGKKSAQNDDCKKPYFFEKAQY